MRTDDKKKNGLDFYVPCCQVLCIEISVGDSK